MPSLHVDAPCSLLVSSCCLRTAGLLPTQGKRTNSWPTVCSIPALCSPHSTATAPHSYPPSSPLLTVLARTRASLMRSRRGVWV